MIKSLLLSLYLTSVLGFSFVTHPVSCCFLLLSGVLSLCLLMYNVMGLSWYILLFCLVYVGGVYMLFVYVSMFSPKVFVGLGYGPYLISAIFLSFFLFFLGWSLDYSCFSENSHYLCSLSDDYGYCFFCFVLLLGFSLMSFVSSSKDSFFR